MIDSLKAPKLPKELEKFDNLIGIKSDKNDLIGEIAGKYSGSNGENSEPKKTAQDKHWSINKVFSQLKDKYGRSFALFVGDLLDIILSGPVQTRLVSEMIDEKISKLKKNNDKEEKPQRKVNVPSSSKTVFDVEIGGEKRIFVRHFLKRKSFLSGLFLDSNDYKSYKKLIRQIEIVCEQESDFSIPNTLEQRKQELQKIVNGLKYEITRDDVIKAWVLLEADCFENLEWIFNETKNMYLVRPSFYEDLDKAYRDGKKLLKLLIKEVKEFFPISEEKQGAFESYLNDVFEVYTHHHFVLKRYHQTRPGVTLRDFDQTVEQMQIKENELRSAIEDERKKSADFEVQRDVALAELRALKNENDGIKLKLQRLDPAEVEKQLQSYEVKINSLNRDLQATIESHSELKVDMKELDKENQELIKQLQQLNAIPDENALSVEGLLKGKRVAIFGGIGRDHYWPILREAGVNSDDYEWYEGYHTKSQSRTSEIAGRCDIVVVVTSYAGHLLLYQIRPCIKEHQHFFKIHNSGAGSLRKEILNAFKKN